MKRAFSIAVLCAFLAVADSPRPIIQVPDALSAEYFRQAWAIEHATARQLAVIEKMKAYCSDNVATLQKGRDKDEETIFVCVPKTEQEKTK